MSVYKVFQNIDLMMEGEIPFMFLQKNQQSDSAEYGFIPELLSWVTGQTKIRTLSTPKSNTSQSTDASGQVTDKTSPFLSVLESEFK